MFGWAELKHALSAEAATDAMILYLKRNALLSIAARDSRIANFLLAATTNELRRTQEHALLIGRSARCRVATFLLDLSKRLGKTKYLELPMSHQDIADHLGLTIETVSRTITELERLQLIARLSPRTLVLLNRPSLFRIKN
jgi:CRP/FNR family nitrogen fixation transcriptional regulator